MKKLLKYRDNSYYNTTDYFLAMNNDGRLLITDLELYNGKWYPKTYKGFKGGKLYPSGYWRPINRFYDKGCTQYNMSTIISVNFNEIKGLRILFKDTLLTGTLTKCIINSFGINWDKQPCKTKEYGTPYFWNDPKNIEMQHFDCNQKILNLL